jgi:hypothetical protein
MPWAGRFPYGPQPRLGQRVVNLEEIVTTAYPVSGLPNGSVFLFDFGFPFWRGTQYSNGFSFGAAGGFATFTTGGSQT